MSDYIYNPEANSIPITLRTMAESEHKYSFAQNQQIEGQCGLIGYLRGDFGKNGCEFYSTWFENNSNIKTKDFSKEFDEVINELRDNPQYRGNSDSYTLKQKDNAGLPTRYNFVRNAIDEAIKNSYTMQDFQYNLKKMGYRYKIADNLKYWTVIPKEYEKPIRLYRLGDDYTNTRILERIQENDSLVCLKEIQSGTKTFEVTKIPIDIRKTKGSLYNLYLYYCYKLGYLPKKKIPNSNRVHYLLREDLMKLDKLTAETELLGKYRIDTDEQLFSIKNSFEKEVSYLSAERAELWKITKRRTIDEPTASKAKII